MTTQRINVALLNKVMDHIEAHPEEWFQNSYSFSREDAMSPSAGKWFVQQRDKDALSRIANPCGTAFCFAGHVAHMTGCTPAYGDYDWSYITDAGGMDAMEIEGYAGEELGLTFEQYFQLFAGTNTLQDLRSLVTTFTNQQEALDLAEAQE